LISAGDLFGIRPIFRLTAPARRDFQDGATKSCKIRTDHDHHFFARLLAIVQPEFHPTTWEAFRRFALDGVLVAQVAAELASSENAELQAKARILKRLRAEAGRLLN
jgi:hypothetical protein